MTAPLTPPGCDLRGLPYFPLDVARLRDSDLWSLSTGDQFKAALALWCRAWGEVPAASIPTDEAWQARAAGVPLDQWRALAPMALRGWVSCDDGRLYHPVIAERACCAWLERLVLKEKSQKGNASRYGLAYDPVAWAAKRAAAGECLARLSDPSATFLPQGAPDRPTGSQGAPTGTVFGSEGEGEEKCKGKEKGSSLVASPSASATPDVQSAFDAYNDVARELGLPVARDLTAKRTGKIARTLKAKGLSGWSEALDALRDSPHCQGRNDRGWKADLDFLLQEDSFQRLTEGRYAGRPTPTPPGGGSYMDLVMERMA